MAKYIKQEMADLNGTGSTQAYYRIQLNRHIDFQEFVERCTRHGGMQRSAVVGAAAHMAHELALLLADGYSVTLDGLGTFRARLGVRPDVTQDGFDAGELQHNAMTIGVRGIAYRAAPSLTQAVDSRCTLERGTASRLRRSALTAEERVAAARRYLSGHPFMRTADYAALTGLSLTTAGRELRRLTADAAASGIVARGRSSARVYVLAG